MIFDFFHQSIPDVRLDRSPLVWLMLEKKKKKARANIAKNLIQTENTHTQSLETNDPGGHSPQIPGHRGNTARAVYVRDIIKSLELKPSQVSFPFTAHPQKSWPWGQFAPRCQTNQMVRAHQPRVTSALPHLIFLSSPLLPPPPPCVFPRSFPRHYIHSVTVPAMPRSTLFFLRRSLSWLTAPASAMTTGRGLTWLAECLQWTPSVRPSVCLSQPVCLDPTHSFMLP